MAELELDLDSWASGARVCVQSPESRTWELWDSGQEQSSSAAGATVRTQELILRVMRSHWRVLNRGLTAGSDLCFKSSLTLPGDSRFCNRCIICVRWHRGIGNSHLSQLMERGL